MLSRYRARQTASEDIEKFSSLHCSITGNRSTAGCIPFLLELGNRCISFYSKQTTKLHHKTLQASRRPADAF